MKKEKITLEAIKSDLLKVAYQQISYKADLRLCYIIPITLLAIIIGVLLKSIIVGVLIFSVAAYHIVRYAIEYKKYRTKKKAITSLDGRGDVSISTEALSHMDEETAHEPHIPFGGIKNLKTIKRYYFNNGFSWRVPRVDKLYSWSKEFYISPIGLENISLKGDEFFVVILQGYHDIAYVYPCKNFELDASLRADI